MKLIKNPKNLTDIELLEQLSSSGKSAFYDEFVSRYYDDVKKECLLICEKRKLDKQIGIQIAHDTFQRVKKTKSFNKQKLSKKCPREAILGWLFRIQSNLFYDYHKSNHISNEPLEFYLDEIQNDVQISSPEELLSIKDIAVKIFNKLNAKEQAVVLKDIEYKRVQRYHNSDVLDDLANELGVKKATIRKIRERAIKKIKDAINQFNEEE